MIRSGSHARNLTWPRPAALLALAAIIGAWSTVAGAAAAAPATVAVLHIEGPIGPATSDYVARSFDKATDLAADLIVMRMDTPGGLASSMRTIIQDLLASPVPVVGFVAPSGARAASAGTYILYACQVAAMAPGTNLGAATPVQIGGSSVSGLRQAQAQEEEPDEQDEAKEEEPDEQDEAKEAEPGAQDETQSEAEPESEPDETADMHDKMVNDAVAYIRSLAQLRDRNADWAERAVREAASLSAPEALAKNVINLIATDLDDLLTKLDGRTVEVGGRELTLELADPEVVILEPDWRTELLSVITNPNVAYILMLIGIYGIILEFYNPGMVFPGVAGAISLLLALYAFQVLPVNYAGLALIGLGLALMVSELFVMTFGALGIGGIVAFVVGSVMLMDTDAPGYGISWQVVGGVSLAAASLLMLLMWMLARSQQRPVVTGQEEMIGSRARVVDWHDDDGRVHVHGEIWQAHGTAGLSPGQEVRVTAIQGLTVEVAPDGHGEAAK